MIRIKVRSTISGLAALLAIQTGCTRHVEESRSNVIVVGLSQPASSLDPRYATDGIGTRLAGLLFSSLVRMSPQLLPEPEAAESWKVEGTKYVFKLRTGLTFSNGREVTADDVRYSFETFRQPTNPFHSSFEGIKETKYDERKSELTLILAQPSATFLTDLVSLKLLPKKEMEAAGSAFAQKPIGSGPFRLISNDGDEIHFQARHDHAYASPKIDELVFKVVRDDNTRMLKMLRGELDLAQSEFPPLKVRRLEREPGLKVVAYPGLATTYLLINHRDPVLSKLEVRKAISLAIDREKITRYKLEGLARPATSLLAPANPYFDKTLKPFEFAPDRAKQLLQTITTTPLELKTSNVPSAVDNGKIIARELSDVGLKIATRSFEWATYYADVKAGRFQLAIMRWVGTIDPDLYRKAYHSKQIPPSGFNRGFYSNPALDQLVEKGLLTNLFDERKSLYDRAQELVYDDLAVVPLWYDTEVAVMNRKVKNYEPAPDGSFWPLTRATKE